MEREPEKLKGLALYGIYSIRYVRMTGSTERIVTPRALFLGEFNKHSWSSSEFMGGEAPEEAPALSRYLDVGFLVYYPRSSGVPAHDVIHGFFEIVLCDPEKGLIRHEDTDVITLAPEYYSVKTIDSGETPAAKKAFEKVYTIAVKTGLIDKSFDKHASGGGRLSRTVVRSIHKGFTEIIRQAP